ncbi:3-ketoacyl-CoA synthase [Sarracenia purpurea var. burkii]
MRWAIHRSGLGESTYVPEAFLKDPPNLSMEEARRESEMVLFGAVDELLVKTKVKCDNIGILVVNCSLFNVTPSLSSVIINKYKFRNNIVNYNLSGMGCSAGLLAIGLAKQLLQVVDAPVTAYTSVPPTDNYIVTESTVNTTSRALPSGPSMSIHPSCGQLALILVSFFGIHIAACCWSTLAIEPWSRFAVCLCRFDAWLFHYVLCGFFFPLSLVVALFLIAPCVLVHHNSYALVVSTETLTPYSYTGNDGSKSLANCIFRVGGAAILLSNQPSDSRSSKYELIQAVHSYMASSDSSYNCIIQEEDEEGRGGITITKDLSNAALDAIKSNLISLGPLVLPFSERAHYLLNCIMRRLHVANIEPYVPNFKRTSDHFLPHVSAKPILDELEGMLGLGEDDMEATRMTLYRFGNTSSSSVWYVLAYAEAKGKIRKGDRVWQMAYGSGFKCSSMIWRAMRTVNSGEMNPWSDEIKGFPVGVKNIELMDYFKPSELR